ncbi:protein ACCELERATED CELL DEATH 6-like isoform X1 [Fagus crenata]
MLEEIAIKNQNLFHVRDTKGKTPLYFAASKGYLEGFKFLLKYSEKSTLERSIKGNFPIHAACKNGHVDIVNELLEQQWPNPTEFLNNEGQNILHIAAKSGKYVVVKNLLRNPKLEMFEINAKDNLGNTALHLASMNLRPNVVCSLTWEDKRVDLELRNNDGLTAVDVLVDRVSMPPSTLRETFTFMALSSAGTKISDAGKKIFRRRSTLAPEQIKDMVNLLSLVTILVATVTFAAGLTVPGGFNSTDKDTGIATLVHKGMFQIFIICDTIALYCSIIGTFILTMAQLGGHRVAFTAFYYALLFLGAALFSMSLAFISAVFVVVSKVTWLAIVVLITGIVFLSFISTIYILVVFPYESSNPVFRCISYYIIPYMFPLIGGNYRVEDYLKKKESDRLAEKDKDK